MTDNWCPEHAGHLMLCSKLHHVDASSLTPFQPGDKVRNKRTGACFVVDNRHGVWDRYYYELVTPANKED